MMMRIHINVCPPGPALDNAVAWALGWKQIVEDRPVWDMPDGTRRTYEMSSFESFRPSEDLTAAWELRPRDKYGYLQVTDYTYGYAECDWTDGEAHHHSAQAETVPLAICRAFLEAHGVEYVEWSGSGSPCADSVSSRVTAIDRDDR